jgi:S-ribosylhomocysteine lyase LuxS involved in autoinducer biosynthesis
MIRIIRGVKIEDIATYECPTCGETHKAVSLKDAKEIADKLCERISQWNKEEK